MEVKPITEAEEGTKIDFLGHAVHSYVAIPHHLSGVKWHTLASGSYAEFLGRIPPNECLTDEQ